MPSTYLPLDERVELLTALVDAIVPRDEFPSATESGALEFLARYFSADGAGEGGRLAAVLDAAEDAGFLAADSAGRAAILDGLLADPGHTWFALLVMDGYYADSSNGGNAGSASWRMLDYDPVPVGGWPASTAPRRAGWIDPGSLLERYDAIVIGSGAGGGTAACVFAEAGMRVLLVERGEWPDAQRLWGDHLRNARAELGYDPLTGPPSQGNPRVLAGKRDLVLWPRETRWGNNAMTAGGGTRVYGAQAWRFAPLDFRMASTYGVPDGSSLADWPISYADLEPWYTRAEVELGVSGTAGADRWAGERSADFPMPAMPETLASRILARGADALGIATGPVPLLVNSVEYGGRSACVRCGACVGFSCPVEAKAGSHNTVIERALATGRCDLLLATIAERILTDARGRVIGVALVGTGGGWRAEVRAGQVAVGAGAVESARLLLNSGSDREPTGLGNGADQVGRHLQAHVYGGAIGIFNEVVVDGLGPGPAISTTDYRHGNPGIVGGGMLANEFVPTPVSALNYLAAAGLIAMHGLSAKQSMRHMLPRLQRIVGPVHEVTSADSRVRLDPSVTDAAGIPVARLSGGLHPEDLRAAAFLGERAQEWLEASGAVVTRTFAPRAADWGPSAGTHQAGTCRMGVDPSRSVTDPLGRVWGHDNLRIVDSATHVTNGGVNPVLTIFANAFRIAEHAASGAS